MKPYQIHDGFYGQAKKLRTFFDKRFRDPLKAGSDRFVWDYWHVPKEYTLLRTPAYTFFPRAQYESFHRYLVGWGRENLGCHDVSPPWLSCYVEGCRQEVHSDVPHGPLAFVYSLTQWKGRKFRGGETFLYKNHEVEIPPQFNRLLLFNPSIPHGVNQVRGTHDPRYARLVIHGWFVNPRPFWVGPLSVGDARDGIEEGLSRILDESLDLGRGLFSTRLAITPSGRVTRVKALVNTLSGANARDLRHLERGLLSLRFRPKRSATRLTLPLLIT